jgi:hypothetical protein
MREQLLQQLMAVLPGFKNVMNGNLMDYYLFILVTLEKDGQLDLPGLFT